MAKSKSHKAAKKLEVKPLSEFNMQEVYRIIHLENIPGYNLLKWEKKYIAEYRTSLLRNKTELTDEEIIARRKEEEAERNAKKEIKTEETESVKDTEEPKDDKTISEMIGEESK